MRTCWRGLLMACLVLGRFGPELAADTIRLKDGSVHHGKKLGSSARKIGFQVDGKLQWFERRDVLSVEINDKGKGTKPKSAPRGRPTPRSSRPERPAHGSGSGSWRVTRVEVRSTASSGSQFSMSSGIAPFLYVYLRFPKAPGVGTLCSLGVVDLRGRSAGKLWGWKNGTDALLIFEGDWSRLSQFTLVGIGRRVNLGRSDTGAPTVRRPRPKPKPKTRGKKKSEPETPSGKPYEVVRKFEHPEGVTGVAFGPDGATLLTGCKNGEAMLWNVADGKKLRVLSGHVKGVNAVAFSPDGSKVVTGSEDNTAVIWNAATGKRLHRLGDHKGAVSAVAFSPDGSLIVTGSADKSVLVWDAATGKRRRRIGLLVNPVKCLAFWPRSKKVVIGTGSVGKGLLAIVGKGKHDKRAGGAWLFGAESGRQIRYFHQLMVPVFSVAFSPDGSKLFTGSWLEGGVLRNTSTGKKLCEIKGGGWFRAAAFHPSAPLLLTAVNRELVLRDVPSGKLVAQWKVHGKNILSVAFAPDGTRAASGAEDKLAILWRPASP